jgi:hypothetical protein
MRYAGWLHPEWGYLAPAPSLLHTVRIALVSAAIGAIGGAIVVISVVARPGSDDDNGSIAHTLQTKTPVITMRAAPAAAGPAQSRMRPKPTTADARSLAPAAMSTSTTNAVANARDPNGTISPTRVPRPDSASASAEIPLTTATSAAAPEDMAPEMAPPKRSSIGKRHLVVARLGKGWRQVKHRRLFGEFSEHRFCCAWRVPSYRTGRSNLERGSTCLRYCEPGV